MTPSKRIALNTLATYGRSVVAAGLALFSSRWVLSALGQTDFGLYSVVGSIIIFLVFLNSILAAGSARFFAYSIGKGDSEEVNRWFNVAIGIHCCMSVVLLAIGWPLGEWVVRSFLTIPPDRVESSVWVFRFAMVAAFFSMLFVPYMAMFNAKQKITEVALIGLLQTLLTFALAFSLQHFGIDRLIVYGFGMMAIITLTQAIQVYRAMVLFPECAIKTTYWFDRSKLKQLFGFTSWIMIGGTGAMLRDQGSAVLLNLYFGPKENAGYAIATQVSAQTNQLSMAMVGAFSPEITASEGRGDRERMLTLANQASKLGTLMILIFSIPIIIEIEHILKIWLITPPPLAGIFCTIMLITFVIDRLSVGSMLAINAHGKIAGYQATVGGMQLLTLPISWLLIHSGLPAQSIGYAFAFTIICITFGRVYWNKHHFNQPLGTWARSVLVPCLLPTAIAATIGFFVTTTFSESYIRLFFNSAAITISFSIATYFLSFSVHERQRITSLAQKKINSIFQQISKTNRPTD